MRGRCRDCGQVDLYDVGQHRVEDCPKQGPKMYCPFCQTFVNDLAGHRYFSPACRVRSPRTPSGRSTVSAGLFSLGKRK